MLMNSFVLKFEKKMEPVFHKRKRQILSQDKKICGGKIIQI